jgi:hypothetical protein
MIDPKCLAPVTLQSAVSAFILATTMLSREETLQKTLALHSFHKSHKMSKMKKAEVFCQVPLGRWRKATILQPCQSWPRLKCPPSLTQAKRWGSSKSIATLQKKCAMDSSFLLQSWQTPQWGQTRPLKPVGSPNSVLKDKPSKVLALQWSTTFPYRLRHEGVN